MSTATDLPAVSIVGKKIKDYRRADGFTFSFFGSLWRQPPGSVVVDLLPAYAAPVPLFGWLAGEGLCCPLGEACASEACLYILRTCTVGNQGCLAVTLLLILKGMTLEVSFPLAHFFLGNWTLLMGFSSVFQSEVAEAGGVILGTKVKSPSQPGTTVREKGKCSTLPLADRRCPSASASKSAGLLAMKQG